MTTLATRLIAAEALSGGTVVRLSGGQVHICDGSASLAAQAAVQPLGLTMTDVASGAYCDDILVEGDATALTGAAVAVGDELICDTSGYLRPLSGVTIMPGQTYYVCATALETLSGAGRCRVHWRIRRLQGSQPAGAVLTETLTGDRTLTVAECVAGSAILDPGGAGRALTLPTAALLVAAGATVGTVVVVRVENSADAAEALTVTAGSGGTVDTPTPTIGQNESGIISILVTSATASAEAYRVYLTTNT